MAFGGSGGVPFCLVCGIVLGVRIENEELSTPVQVRGIGCLAGYADSWAGRVVFERLTRNGAFSPLLATARNKKEKPSQYVTATALKSGAEGGTRTRTGIPTTTSR